MAGLIVFDLDGTLIDTAPDLIGALNRLFVKKGLPELPFEIGRPMIGGGVRALIEKALAAEGVVASEAELDRLFAEYLDLYVPHIADHSRPYPGLVAALDDLEERGFRFAVCTNKLEALSLRIFELLNLTHRFAAICGQDTFGVKKPDPEMLRRTIAQAGGDIARSIMVGDSVNDIDAAKGAGVPVIAVSFGYSEQPIACCAPDAIIDHYSQLPDEIGKLLR